MNNSQEALDPQEKPRIKLNIRIPKAADGVAVHNLIRKSAFVDNNSLYCYLLVCTHFAQTSAIAERNGETMGVITAYIPPQQPDTLFVWQVAVDPLMRRRGLARSMLRAIVQSDACRDVRFIETTVTADNTASRKLFSTFSEKLNCPVQESVLFERREHFLNLHDSEHLLRIGPFNTLTSQETLNE